MEGWTFLFLFQNQNNENQVCEISANLASMSPMSTQTDALVKKLCGKLLTVKTEAEIDTVLSELRNALQEHVRLARNSLGAQLETLKRKSR